MSAMALVNAVIEGLGISVLPHGSSRARWSGGLAASVKVEGLDSCRQFPIICHKGKYLPAVAKAFLGHCRDFEQNDPLPRFNGLY